MDKSNSLIETRRSSLRLIDLKFERKNKVMVASDAVSTKRVVLAVPKIVGNGLLAIQFKRDGESKEKIPIQVGSDGSPKMFLELGSKVGVLVFIADQYEKNSELFK